MNITVFCSSSPRPGDPAYEEGIRVGRLLAENGHTVLTGGYIGLMEAVSRGASEAGGRVLGLTCDEIESWRPVAANPWVQEERRYPTQMERLYGLMTSCDAALALPGGIGTLAEVAEMWSHLQTGAIPTRPLALIGPGWKAVFDQIFSVFDAHIKKQYRRLLIFAPTIEDAIAFLTGVQPG
ncbi:MAG: LOG family protein [Chloroflexi bacterium]|nr:LOG family protein [Chloroflexota bacterium]